LVAAFRKIWHALDQFLHNSKISWQFFL